MSAVVTQKATIQQSIIYTLTAKGYKNAPCILTRRKLFGGGTRLTKTPLGMTGVRRQYTLHFELSSCVMQQSPSMSDCNIGESKTCRWVTGTHCTPDYDMRSLLPYQAVRITTAGTHQAWKYNIQYCHTRQEKHALARSVKNMYSSSEQPQQSIHAKAS